MLRLTGMIFELELCVDSVDSFGFGRYLDCEGFLSMVPGNMSKSLNQRINVTEDII